MKTIREWFEKAKSDGFEWADKAIANLDPDSANDEYDSLGDALYQGFTWTETAEGYEYWWAIEDSV